MVVQKPQLKTSRILNRAYLADRNAESNGECQPPLSAKTRHVSQGSRSYIHPSMQETGWRRAPTPLLPKQLAPGRCFYLDTSTAKA